LIMLCPNSPQLAVGYLVSIVLVIVFPFLTASFESR
jgi:hypothetical protein